jgi:hypothetical protein
MFVELDSVEKNCPIIVNLEHVVEIAPLREGGCALFLSDSAGMNSKTVIRVKNTYDQFKQFAMQTVTPEMIASRFPKVTVATGDTPAEAPRGRGRPPKIQTPTATDEGDVNE